MIHRRAIKHTGTVPLVLHTDRCTSTHPVIETQSNTQVQYLWCYTHTDRCTSTYHVIERQSNIQVQYLWYYTQTDVPVPTL